MSRDQKFITKYLFPTYDLDLGFETNLSHHIHELMKKVWGGNFSSPIEQGLNNKKGFKVLDVGCGDKCLWLLELSKKYPLAEFIGLDLLPSSLPKDSSQNNLRYIQGDVLKGLPFEDNSIDFVHLRCLIVAFTERQWEEIVVKELIRICKPGGWIEISDIDVDGKSLGPTTKRFITACMSTLEIKGINSLISEEIPEFLESTNQVELYAEEKYCPIGNWGGDVGRIAVEFFVIVYKGLKDLSNWLRVSREEYENMISQYVKEVEKYRSYFITTKFYCQKITS